METALIVTCNEKSIPFFTEMLNAASIDQITVLRSCGEARRLLLERPTLPTKFWRRWSCFAQSNLSCDFKTARRSCRSDFSGAASCLFPRPICYGARRGAQGDLAGGAAGGQQGTESILS